MRSKNYVVKRKDIYVGSVVKTDRIVRLEYDDLLTNKGQLDTGAWIHLRTMLFVPDQNSFSNDLLYDTESYPVLNITNDNFCYNLNGENIVIKDICNLDRLLEYYGYDEELTYEDIVRIKLMFFSGNFAKNNAEVFGMKESQPEERKYIDKDGKEITDKKKLKKIIKKEKKLQEKGTRMFYSLGEGDLPSIYWEILDSMGNKKTKDVIRGYEKKKNAFKPHKEEPFVKKMKRK